MKFGSLNSKVKTHEGVVDLNQAFFNANWVVQAELLSDLMAELQKYYIHAVSQGGKRQPRENKSAE